jgi:hypothetical protein
MTTTDTTPRVDYDYGFGNFGHRGEWQVLKNTEGADGQPGKTELVLSGISETKAKAIVLILNAPENQ